MKKIELIATDLDGTLLTDDKRISKVNLKAINDAVDAGIYFVPSTGRALYTIPENVLSLEGVKYVITSNGAAVTDLKTKEIIYKKQLDINTAQQVIEYGLEMGIMVEIFVNGRAYTLKKFMARLVEYGVNPKFTDWMEDTRTVVNEFEEILKNGTTVENINMIYTDLSKRVETHSYLTRNLEVEVTNSLGYNLEVGAKGCSKGEALEALAKKLSIDMGKVMCLGDNDNDRDMLRRAGISIAMANADNTLKENVTYVSKGNNEDGFAHAVYKYAFN
ncbi:MAG: Cof-type HAD-IIB family hydrolase [Candidatus Metalachnospira sp.]|nr:Cof-type HAD-IIB family hydrolase [Candidatus Metalachnospira sp.]